MIEAKKNDIFEEIDEIKSVEVFESDNEAVFKSGGENLKNYRIYGQTVGGESVGDRTGNLFDGVIEQGGLNGATGAEFDSDNRCRSSYILLGAGTYTISISSSHTIGLFIFSSTNVFETFVSYSDSPITFSLETVKKVRFGFSTRYGDGSITPSDISSIMLNTGSTALPYEPYGYKVPVTVEGKNLLQNTATSQTINGVTFTVNDDGSVTCNTDENGATATTRFYLVGTGGIDFKKLNINANAIITGCPHGGNVNTYSLFILRTNDDMEPKYNTWADTGNGFNLPYNETNKYVIYINISTGTICDNLTFYPMIRKADIEDDTYEPYQPPVTTNLYLPEQIRKVGDGAEYIDYGEQKLHRVRKNLFYITKFINNNTQVTAQGVNFSIIDNEVYANGTSTGMYPQTIGFDYVLTEGETYAATLYIEGEYTGLPYIYCITTYDSAGNYQKVPPNVRTIFTALPDTRILFVAQGTGESFNIKYKLLITKATIEDDTYEPYITNTELDVTLPALPTLTGTNVLSVNTNIKPSKVWGRLDEPKDILYVKDNLGNILFSKYHEVEEEPPLTYKAKKAGTLTDYRIYGQTSRNLFDGEWFSGLVPSAKDGELVYSSAGGYTDYISIVSGNITLTVQSTGTRVIYVFLYANDKSFIGVAGKQITNYGSVNSIAIDGYSNAKYVRLRTDDLQGSLSELYMLNTGSEPLPYEPYGESVGDRTGNLFDKNGVWVNGYINDNGELAENDSIATYTNFIKAKPDTVYSFICDSSVPEGVRFNYYDSSKNFISRIFRNMGNPKVTTPSTCEYITLSVNKNQIQYLMIIEGSTAPTEYEPYGYKVPVTVSNGTDTLTTPIYLSEQIKKVGSEEEYIDYSEQKQHRVRKNLLQNTSGSSTIFGVTYTVNDDGSITCNTDENGATRDSFYYPMGITLPSFAGKTIILSGGTTNIYVRAYHYQGNNTISSNGNDTEPFTMEQGFIDIYVPIGTVLNNVTIFPMARLATIADDTYEPYITNTELDVTLPALPTVAGTNVLSVGTEVQPSEVYIKGKLKVIN